MNGKDATTEMMEAAAAPTTTVVRSIAPAVNSDTAVGFSTSFVVTADASVVAGDVAGAAYVDSVIVPWFALLSLLLRL